MLRIYTLLITIILINGVSKIYAQELEDWREVMKLLIYSPRYFGPNAFPIPTLLSGIVGNHCEVELCGEYHYYTGDKTKNIYGRLYIPLVKGKVAFEVSCTVETDFILTTQTQEERHASGTKNSGMISGDIIFGNHYQILRSEKWADIVGRMYLRTASGHRLSLARFSDAAGYWFDITFGKTIFRNPSGNAFLRLQGMAGFYCWMTNSLIHRQNDAISYGIGINSKYKNLVFQSDLSGYHGYEKNGDSPLELRTNLNCELGKNILSIRYRLGMKDVLYDTYSLGFIRYF